MGNADPLRRASHAQRNQSFYRHKSVRPMRRRQTRVAEKWQSKGWELVSQQERRFRPKLTFRKPRPNLRWNRVIASAGLALCLVTALVVASMRMFSSSNDPAADDAHDDAAVAVHALREGNLEKLENYLSAYRGDRDFAYYFASQTDARALGDALGTVATHFHGAKFDADFDPEVYAFLIPDLAGVLSLAVGAGGKRAMPATWTKNFVAATTYPRTLDADDEGAEPASVRTAQDEANKQNLLLLLANGNWPTEFLKRVTTAYTEFDKAEGEDAWPGPQDDGGLYAPAPSGLYLTDGMVALTAALTANPEASAWAFADFQPAPSRSKAPTTRSATSPTTCSSSTPTPREPTTRTWASLSQ